jgi:hypothetical protein
MSRLAKWMLRRWAWLDASVRRDLFTKYGTNGIASYERWLAE